jgi:hypothetical protein
MNTFTRRRVVLHVATMAEPFTGPSEPFALEIAFPTTPILCDENLPAEVSVAAFARDGDACELLGSATTTLRNLELAKVHVECDGVASGSWTIEAAIEVQAFAGPHSKRRILRGVSIEQVGPPTIQPAGDDALEPLRAEAP